MHATRRASMPELNVCGPSSASTQSQEAPDVRRYWTGLRTWGWGGAMFHLYAFFIFA
jgi:hypothetical protein